MSEQSAYQQNEETEQQISNHQKEKTMKAIDKSVPAYYAAGREYHRLRENIGLIEFERTKEIILENLPKPPAVIYDIGGAYGEYAWWLAHLGYEVHLFDLSETNIRMSAELAEEYPDFKRGLRRAKCPEGRQQRGRGAYDGTALSHYRL